jgi:phage baseplate assembly protein W
MTHIAFPLRLDASGRTARADDEAYLRGLIEQVLFTRPGERVERPDFGSGVAALVFATNGDELVSAARSLVQAALQQHLGELIRVDDVRVAALDAILEVTVVYTPMTAPAGDTARVLRLTGPGAAGGAP